MFGRMVQRTPRQVACLIVVGVFACTACSSGDASGPTRPTSSSAADENSTPSTTPISAPVIPDAATAGSNQHLAMVAAAHTINNFPVPAGATRIDAPPPDARYLRRLHGFTYPVDTSLTRTRWWLVPRRHDRLVAWYVAHTPAVRGTTLIPGASKPSPEAQIYWQTQKTSKAYSSPAEVVAYTRLGPNLTAIRTDVTLAARADRTAKTLVPTTVTSLQITRSALNAANSPPETVTVTDQSHIYTVIAAFNNVPGEYTSVEPHGCHHPGRRTYYYAVTFHWPGHALDVDTGQPLCDVGRSLTLDDAKLPQTLTDSPQLNRALRTAYNRS